MAPYTDEDTAMDADAKKTALRMIPYGIHVPTALAKDGATGQPILANAAAAVECKMVEILERGEKVFYGG